MKRLNFKHWLLALLATATITGGVFLTTTSRRSFAAPPSSEARESSEKLTKVEGKVVEVTTAPKGEIDGVILDDGTWVHWPPHLEEEYAALAKPGSRVQAQGRQEVNREGKEWFETFTLTNLETKASYEREDAGPPPKRPHHGPNHDHGPRTRSEKKTIEGTIQSFTTAPKGETDGAVFEDGTVIHWPPHRQEEFASLMKVGDRVRVSGWNERAPRGESRFEVASLEGPSGRSDTGHREQNSGKNLEARIQQLEERLERIERQLSELLSR